MPASVRTRSYSRDLLDRDLGRRRRLWLRLRFYIALPEIRDSLGAAADLSHGFCNERLAENHD